MTIVFETDKLDEFLTVKKELKAKGVRLRDFRISGKKMMIEVGNWDERRAIVIIKRAIHKD